MPLRVNVIMGGPSAEHEISLLSGIEVLKNMDRKRYAPRAVVISLEQEFYFCDASRSLPTEDEFAEPSKSKRFKGPLKPYASEAIWKDCDVAFLAVHGSFGEDGLLQGYLDTLKVPYTGSSVFASAVAMNKIATKFILEQNGIKTPPFFIAGRGHPEVTWRYLVDKFEFPMFVKCPQSGSSRLMTRVDCGAGLGTKIEEFLDYSPQVLVEKGIKGPEFTCPVLEMPDGITRPLPPIEIRPIKSNYFNFESKYKTGGSEEIVPVKRAKKLVERMQELALRCHTLLSCRGVSRTDMILADDGELYVLEINSLPGLTANSLLPKSFKAAGGSYRKLIDVLIQVAIKNPITP
jgi:D-alanine-D-alanine ligase